MENFKAAISEIMTWFSVYPTPGVVFFTLRTMSLSYLVEMKYRWSLTYRQFNLVLTVTIGKQYGLYLVKLSLNID